MSQYPYVSTEMQTCERGSAPKQFSQLVFTCTEEWRSRRVSTLCDMRKSVVSCPEERYVSVSFIAIVSILLCQASELVALNFGLLITNHSHF